MPSHYGSFNRRLPSVPVGQFSMVPRSDVPRSVFRTKHSHKTTFDAGKLIPIHVDEVLPGDVHEGRVTVFARMATPLFPIMDNLHLETFFFFVPNRLVWNDWEKFCGEQDDPGDSIAFVIPQTLSPTGGFAVLSLADYFGIPPTGQQTGNLISVNALPFRAYNLIYNEWFRDENLQNSVVVQKTAGPDVFSLYNVLSRGKRHDYFTSCLPWPLKGGLEVPLPLSGSARISSDVADSSDVGIWSTVDNAYRRLIVNATPPTAPVVRDPSVAVVQANSLYADLSTATGATINALRLAVTTQQFLEKDARGGTRYTELLRNHFGVMPEDMRLQRPEYIGGGHSVVTTDAIPQTSEPTTESPLGALGATSTISGQHSFRYHATEHGYIIGLANIRADLTYQQGIKRMWSRRTRYDFYWPVFANLGEQVVFNHEIFAQGSVGGVLTDPANVDGQVFGYQERWAEYRHRPSLISGLFRSTEAGTIDQWHLAQEFASLPALNASFIVDAPPMARVLAAGALANGQQFLFDSLFDIKCTRALPQFSVPGLMRF